MSCIANINEPPTAQSAQIIFATSASPADVITTLDFGATAIVPGRSIEEIFIINAVFSTEVAGYKDDKGVIIGDSSLSHIGIYVKRGGFWQNKNIPNQKKGE